MTRQIVFDTETTGLRPEDGHRVIEIGCVEMVNRRLTGNTYHVYINPEREVEEEALQVHGITNEFLADKPAFKEIAEEFVDFVKGAELIAHNATFDVGFINHEFKLARLGLGKIAQHCKIFDTLKLARKMHPGQRNSLDALSKRYQVEHFNRELHGALLDAEILAHVYLAMTGGQVALFGEQQEAEKPAVEATGSADPSLNTSKLIVIKATPEEQTAHEAITSFVNTSHRNNLVNQ